MDNCEGGVVSSDARQARLLPEHHNAVGRACKAASDDPRHVFPV